MKQDLHLTKANGKIIINWVVRETPIGMSPKIFETNNKINKIVRIKEVLVIFSCLLKIL